MPVSITEDIRSITDYKIVDNSVYILRVMHGATLLDLWLPCKIVF